jgi:ribosomal subunit interface protein
MKVTISGKHIEVGDSLRSHIETRLGEITSHYLTDLLEANIVVSKNTFQFTTEISLHVSHNFIVRARAEDQDAYRSVDLVFGKVEARLKRYKSRLKDRKKHHDPEAVVWSAQKYVIDKEAEDKGEDNPLIIAEMTKEIPTLSVSEAVMQMDLSESPALLFRNPKSGVLNVVYRREDGHIGWVSPDQGNK